MDYGAGVAIPGDEVVRRNAIRRNEEGPAGIAHLTNKDDAKKRARLKLADTVSDLGRVNKRQAEADFDKRKAERELKAADRDIADAEAEAKAADERVRMARARKTALANPTDGVKKMTEDELRAVIKNATGRKPDARWRRETLERKYLEAVEAGKV